MGQEEFLYSFQEALAGKVSDIVIQENMNYYRSYINQEIQSGKTEEEVLRALGDPRLLAKTIVESNKFANGETGDAPFEREGWSFQSSRQGGTYTQDQDYHTSRKTFQLPSWAMRLLLVVVVFLVIWVVFSVVSYLAPVIFVVAAVVLIYKMITGSGRRR